MVKLGIFEIVICVNWCQKYTHLQCVGFHLIKHENLYECY